MENNTHTLLTRKEVSLQLRVSPPTLKRWRDQGILKAVKIGRTVRYYREDIEKLLTPKDSANG